MAVSISDTSRMSGVFSLVVYNREGKIIESYTDHNLIVDAARTALAHLVSSGDASGSKRITRLGVGTNPDSPTPVDRGLTDPQFVDVLAYNYPSEGAVTFKFRLTEDDANGMAICEYGLFCADGTLFARKTRTVITKQSDLVFEITWTIKF